MNKINRKVEYALLALKQMSKKPKGQLTSAKEICQTTGAAFDTTSRVMQLMASQKILKSEYGAQGGYQIVKDLNHVSLYEVMETVLGPLEIVKCANGVEDCELFNKCGIQSPLQQLNLMLRSFYQDLSIADLLNIKSETGSREWATLQRT